MSAPVYTNATGRALTRGLFYETTLADKTGVLYTLKDKDHMGFPSLYRLYMELDDITEYEFANAYLEGWAHWQMLCNSTWFKEFIDRWRWELELKTKALAIRRLRAESAEGGKNAYSANKFLVEGGWKDKDEKKNVVGRPSQERIKQEAEKLNQMEKDIFDDHERLNFN